MSGRKDDDNVKKLTKILIFLLMIDAAWVFFGLCMNWVMWPFICLYWLILTAKNYVDWVSVEKKEESNNE